MMIVINTFCTAVKNKTIKTIKKIYPSIPSAQVSMKTSFTISPLLNEKRVMIEAVVSSNLVYFQNIHYPKNTNPKKKGRTPRRNMKILDEAFCIVEVIRLTFLLY